MDCPSCGCALEENVRFCPECGSPLLPETEPPVFSDVSAFPEPLPKKRRYWVVPTGLMCGMFLLGLVCFTLLPFQPGTMPESQNPNTQNGMHSQSGPQIPTIPNRDRGNQNSGGTRDKSFVPTNENCFRMTDGGLVFLPQKYNGNPVLVIPNEIDGIPVTMIAAGGFAGLEGVTTVILPDALESIGEGAFENCLALRGIYFPKTMTSIGRNAFAGCISLESVSVGSAMESIGAGAFSGCASLRFIFYSGTFDQWTSLYNEYVNPFTCACCSDGDYYHGVNLQ